jgi:GNAT superfamily N-acetyltransferase
MLDYRVEKLDDRLKEEMLLLADIYWEEVAAPFHDFPPDLDWVFYRALDAAGFLRIVIGRNERGQLKAGVVVVIGPHPHYACIYGTVPLLFLHPDYRKGSEGMRLVRLAERAAEKAGAQLLMTHGGMHNGVYRLFEGMHYQDFGKYYVKVLKEGPNGVKPVFKQGAKEG